MYIGGLFFLLDTDLGNTTQNPVKHNTGFFFIYLENLILFVYLAKICLWTVLFTKEITTHKSKAAI